MEDAVIVGSGPNGLAAAVELARAGVSVRVLEARDEIGGGIRSAELTLPGFLHDVCSGCHPMGALSPFFRELPLAEHGLRWIHPLASVAHPLDDGPALLLRRSLQETASGLGADARAYEAFFAPFVRAPHDLPPTCSPRSESRDIRIRLARFGLPGPCPRRRHSALSSEASGRAAAAGCAAHSIPPRSGRSPRRWE